MEAAGTFGLIKAAGGMDEFPVRFHTLMPSKFCTPPKTCSSDDPQNSWADTTCSTGLSELQVRQRNRKLLAAHDQFTPRHRLVAEGFSVPQDTYPPLTVFNNNGTHVDRALARRINALSDKYGGGNVGVGGGGALY